MDSILIDKDTIKRCFSGAHSTYDDYATIQNYAIDKLISFIPSGRSFRRIVEIGCGTGNLTLLLRRLFPESELVAVDLSNEMINVARLKVENAEYLQDDAESLPREFYDRFDMIISANSIHWFRNPFGFIKNLIDKSLKKTILFNTYGNLTLCELNEILGQKLAATYFASKDEWVEFLETNFKDLFSIEHEIKTICYPDLLSLLKALKYTGTNINIQNNITLTRDKILKIEKKFLQKYNHIKISYELIYVIINT